MTKSDSKYEQDNFELNFSKTKEIFHTYFKKKVICIDHIVINVEKDKLKKLHRHF